MLLNKDGNDVDDPPYELEVQIIRIKEEIQQCKVEKVLRQKDNI